MELIAERFKSSSNETFGKLYVDGKFECFTLEDEYREKKVKGETRIPAGKYKVGTRYSPKFSPKFGHEMLWVKDVPGFEFILIHTGNTDSDTEGCLIVGEKIGFIAGKPAILDSMKAYRKLYAKVIKALKEEEVTIEYRDLDRGGK